MRELSYFCPECGTELNQSSADYQFWHCSKCGMKHKTSDVSCEICMSPLYYNLCPNCDAPKLRYCVHCIEGYCRLYGRRNHSRKKCRGIFVDANGDGSITYIPDKTGYYCKDCISMYLTRPYIFTKDFQPVEPNLYPQILFDILVGRKTEYRIIQICR